MVPALVPIIIFGRSFTSTLPTIHFRPDQHPTPGAPPTSPDGTPSIGYVLIMWTSKAGRNQFSTLVPSELSEVGIVMAKGYKRDSFMTSQCPFCDESLYKIEGKLTFIKKDSYPVSKGHHLVITKRHVASYFDCTPEEREELWQMIDELQQALAEEYNPDGFNIGINIEAAAGQTVQHMHIHLIPRYKGDMVDPAGGVRGVIPEKQKY